MLSESDFDSVFQALTGHTPLAWQRRLFKHFAARHVPAHVTLPTGLGKTSVIPVWLIALAQSASEHADGQQLPRRLVYIVNRRTVVDQATDIVVKMRERLLAPDDAGWRAHAGALHALAEALRRLAGADCNEAPLAVSTLRGELADNEEWKVNPARPAIIIGTIDMVGSKLLFSGYGDGRYRRAHHAGLIGQDALIVHDEAHLTPAFGALLKAIETEQQREQARNGRPAQVSRPIRVVELSATTRSDGGSGGGEASQAFGVEDEDNADSVIQQRLRATKLLSLAEVDAHDALVSAIVEASLRHDDKACRVLIYVRSPETATEVVDGIKKKLAANSGSPQRGRRGAADRSCGVERAGEGAGVTGADPLTDRRGSDSDGRGEARVGLLTGTIRGYERDLLAESDLFKAFKADAQRPAQLERTLYLVSTAAGEVGVDLDADHLVCDLTTLDSMIQRFGRVNRLGGGGRSAEISLIVEKPAQRAEGKADKKSKTASPLDAAIAKTGEILRGIADNGGDVSPAALGKVLDGLSAEEKRAAFSPAPTILLATDILFDAWSLTSVAGEMPGRPQVAEYLHGVAEWEPPETFVAWRAEVRQLADARVDSETLAEWFEACPVLAHERVRDRTDRVRAAFDKLLKNRRKKTEDANFDVPVVLLNERGEARFMPLSELTGKPNGRDPLAYATVVLPIEVGGLNESGMLDETAELRERIDVAEETPGHAAGRGGPRRRERWLCVRDADGERWKHLLSDQETEGPRSHLRERARVTLKEPPEGTGDEGSTEELVLLSERAEVAAENAEHARFAEALTAHSERVAAYAGRMATALNLPQAVREAVNLAARWHDRGKERPVWQRYARNRNFADPLAKSEKYGHPHELGGYRHEFGSLLEAAADAEIQNHPERELILHLIAAHHGWARPHFESAAQDNEGPVDSVTGQRRRPTTRENEAVAIEAMQRFGRLQLRFGRWGLAWLESLLRCADALASGAPQTPSVANEAADVNCITAAQDSTPFAGTGGTA